MKRLLSYTLVFALIFALAIGFSSCDSKKNNSNDNNSDTPHTKHSYTPQVTAPTCTEEGYTTHTCDCGHSYISNTTFAIGHHYVDAICSLCGKELKDSVGLEYTVNKYNTCYTVSGIGTCTDTDIKIPSTYNGLPVTSIGENALYTCKSFTSITIPDSITSIGRNAFKGCSNLTNVYITDIAAWCEISFDGYASNPLYYADNLYLAEKGETKLITDLVIPDDATSIGDCAFCNYSNLTSITIPNSITSIGRNAFGNCSNLASVTISDGVTSIGGSAFMNCSNLTSITIPDSVTSIGSSAFRDCSRLESITLSFIGARKNGVIDTHFGYIFGANSHYSNYEYIPTTLKNVIITDASSISNYAFNGCHGLTSITIPNSVTTIGVSAFSGCQSLTSITIPDSVTTIGDSAFIGCSNLENINYNGTVAEWNAIDKTYDSINNCIIYCTDGEIAIDGKVTYY